MLSPIFQIAGLAVAYALSGRLGLLLAVPPGYATAIWAGSGIALAAMLSRGCRLWPGVLLGSLVVNLWTGFDSTAALRSFTVAAAIATGATLQALLGVALVRRVLGEQPVGHDERRVLLLLFLGGPVACLLNATVGTATLWSHGLLPAAFWWNNFGTWWVGDTIGVLVFTPVLLVWLEPQQLRSWRRRLSISLPMLLMFAAVVVLFLLISQREQQRISVQFQTAASDVAEELQESLQRMQLQVAALAAYFNNSQSIDRRRFQDFSSTLLAAHPNIQGLAFSQSVAAGELDSFVAEVRADGQDGFVVREMRAGQLQPVSADDRARVVIRYMVPESGNESAIGFDISSNPLVVPALAAARSAGAARASAPIRLVQESGDSAGVVLYSPVGFGAQPGAVPGYVSGVLRVTDLLRSLIDGGPADGLAATLQDQGVAGQAGLLFESGQPASGDGLSFSFPLEFGGRHWELQLSIAESRLFAARSWQAWSLLAAGLLMTATFGVFLLLLTGRSESIARLVAERTERLTAVNDALMDREASMDRLVRELRSSERRLRDTAANLAVTNKELEQFAYVASHDLKAPLRTVASFAQLLERRLGDQLDGEISEYLGYIRCGVNNMHELTDDLLSMSRLQNIELQRETVALSEVMQQAQQQMAADIASSGAIIQVADMPIIEADRSLLVQVFQNLLANGIKFQPPGQAPEIQILAQGEQDGWQISVIDNGIGMQPEHQQRIFKIFNRLHTQDQYPGTGLGLALSRKIVELHGGHIRAESEPGRGTRIHLWLPGRAPEASAGLSVV